MTDPKRTDPPQPDPAGTGADAPANVPPKAGDPQRLTPEEQMARYEEDLKENDWGHRPC